MGLQVQVLARRVAAAADQADDLPGEDLFSSTSGAVASGQ
jgi:hypothetical protein